MGYNFNSDEERINYVVKNNIIGVPFIKTNYTGSFETIKTDLYKNHQLKVIIKNNTIFVKTEMENHFFMIERRDWNNYIKGNIVTLKGYIRNGKINKLLARN